MGERSSSAHGAEVEQAPGAPGVWAAACSAVRSSRKARHATVAPDARASALTVGQLRNWRVDAHQARRARWHLHYTVSITGDLDPDRFQAAFAEVVRVQHALRTKFSMAGETPVQHVMPALERCVRLVDLAARASDDASRELNRLVDDNWLQPLDLLDGPPFRAALVRTSADRHVFLFACHHVCWDGWSWQVFTRDLRTAFGDAGPAPIQALPAPPVQLADVAAWERSDDYRQTVSEQVDYWRRALVGLPASTRLFGGRSRGTGEPCASRSFTLPPAVLQGFRRVRAQTDASMCMIAIALVNAVVLRHTGVTDSCIGVPMANRARPELRRLIGPMNQLMLLRTDLSGDPSFRELLARVRSAFLEGASRLDAPYEAVNTALLGEGRVGGPPTRVQVDWRCIPTESPRLGAAEFGKRRLPPPDGPILTWTGQKTSASVNPNSDVEFVFNEFRDEMSVTVTRHPEFVGQRDMENLIREFIQAGAGALWDTSRRLSTL